MLYYIETFMNNKKGFVFLILFSLPFLTFISCSNTEQENSAEEETPTLRYTANSLYESTIWTEAVELDRLTSNISAVPGVSSRINLSPLAVLASKESFSKKVFPVLGSFGSLDTTLISKSLREMLTSFSDAVSKNTPADSFMAKDCLYSLALFYTDFNKIFGDCLELNKVEEPVAEDSAETDSNSEAKTEDAAESKAEPDVAEQGESPKKIEEKLYFTSYFFGQPFLDGVCYEVPVKFFCDKATLTLSVFCIENSGSWKIDQVQIADWEIF